MNYMKMQVEELKNTMTRINGYWISESAEIYKEVFGDIYDMAITYADCFPDNENKDIKSEVFESELLD